MSLAFIGPSGTAEHRWIVYALLRDNVQHHLQGGSHAAADFTAIHAIQQALGGEPVAVRARQLREEVDRARVLLARPITELAVSERTRAIVERSGRVSESASSGATVADPSFPIPWLSPRVQTLDGVFGGLVRSLLAITENASETDTVEIDDG